MSRGTDRPLRIVAGTVLVLAGFRASPGYAQEPSVREIIDRAVVRAEEQRLSLADLDFQALVESLTEHLDGDGRVKKAERETCHQYPLGGVLFEELVAKDGKPLDEDNARSERERRREFSEQVRERRAKGRPR